MRVPWRWPGALVVASLVGLTSACIPPRPPSEPARPEPTASTPEPAPTTTPSVTVDPSGVAVDDTLLDLLPDAVDGVPIVPDPATAAAIAADGSVASFLEAIAVATAIGPQASGAIGDYVVVTVARLRPDTFGDLFYRGWRDTFDDAVCAQAGGIDGHAEADIGPHHAFIGTCAGGVHTYHVHLPAHEVIVSMQAVGDGRFGERVVAGLTE